MEFNIIENGIPAEILVEECALEGVKRIAEQVADDIEIVCGSRPKMVNNAAELTGDRVMVFATIGHSEMVDKYSVSANIDTSVIEGKKECWMTDICEIGKIGVDRNGRCFWVIGSDKRGSIYGMFSVSEACGVTSLVYMGDSQPERKSEVMLTDTRFVSKEPSVEYRGYFINDEWPAFGNWCNEQFGGFNSECYEKLFIFLLRMKGNFMWPAMWSSVFSEDGPGIENARLADTLGIIMGTSHHEPLCRAGEEWQHIYRRYGDSNAWNFISNKEAISEFWKDGILRNRDFENLVTIGMRGEADSKLLGENATMADNIKVVKDAILTQHEILREYVNEDLCKIPRVLAIYKEVEDYYYGDETCEGLKDWDELKDVIFLLSDDNWANTRGLPTGEERKHPGGYGMYYHFDYHGGPYSYEWQNTSRLTKIWEQMTQAYEYGVKREWIVNVGDLKGNEYPLTYFMELAYDYEKWSRPRMTEVFASEWVDRHFHGDLNEAQKNALLRLMEGATRLNALRKPESLHSDTYHPVNYNECERVGAFAREMLGINEGLHNSLKGNSKTAFESIFYYQTKASLNILLMQIDAGINAFLADNRSLAANIYEEKVKEHIAECEAAIDEYNRMLDGKWNHMLDSGFTGFRNWDDYDWGYPITRHVTPIRKPKAMAGFAGDDRFHLGEHWQDGERIRNTDMISACDKVKIYVDSRGNVDFDYRVMCDTGVFSFEPQRGHVDVNDNPRAVIEVTCDKSRIADKCVVDGEIDICVEFADGNATRLKLAVSAAAKDYLRSIAGKDEITDPQRTYVENNGYICINADHFAENTKVQTDKEKNNTSYLVGWEALDYLGRCNPAIKCLPSTADFSGVKIDDPTDAFKAGIPYAEYDFIALKDGEYSLEIDVLSRNPVVMGHKMTLRAAISGEVYNIETVVDDYYTSYNCAQWCDGVLDNVRRIQIKVKVKSGINKLYIFACSPNISIDRIILSNPDTPLKESYLGPEESAAVSDLV
ncbi:MAG: glycosyl hydrolase 115 family protein [Lachnospiraceae bacterium]|nr:glycosyl hydrolase 115 family protein [Lachnospiraceae bacterium]